MPAEIQNGTAIVFGITNDGTPISMLGYASFILESGRLGHKFKLDETPDETGFDTSLVATNEKMEVEITWTPSGATRAAAAATAILLTPLSKVTLAHFKVAAFNGDWIYIGDESLDLTRGANGKMSLKIRQYADAGQNTSLSTTVVG